MSIAKQGVSIIIGARNEFPQIAMTINNLMEDMKSSGLDRWEIIVMDNGSSDETSRFFGWKPTNKGARWTYEKSPRGVVASGRLKIFYDPVLSNVGTRNKGVLKARYDNIIFSDAHIIVKPGTVRSMVESLDKYGGIIHAPVSWMGSDPYDPKAGYQYSYKVGEKIWGTWNKIKVADTPFFIPQCGHCFIAVKRDQFLEFGGYPLAQRVYGGGEPYLDTKWWMVGSHVMCDPNALVYHLSAGRGYAYDSADLIHNMFLVSYILGGQKWIDRILITYLNKRGANPDYVKFLYNEAIQEGEADKAWLDENKKVTFDQLLGLDNYAKIVGKDLNEMDEEWLCKKCTKRGRPDWHVMREWDRRNDELHGTHRSYVQEFRLTRNEDGVFIGKTPITDPEALEIASRYV